MNRKNIFYLLIILSATILYGCSENNKIQKDDPVIVLSQETLHVDCKGGAQTLYYSIQNAEEGIKVSAESDEKWICDIKASEKKVEFTVSENVERQERQGTIEISCKGSKNSAVLTITQEAASDNVIVSVDGVKFKMILVEGGTFTMGADDKQRGDAFDFELPRHSVTLSDYYIGEFEVTQRLWMTVMGKNPSGFKGSPDLPVEMVSREQVKAFIGKLSELTGERFSLPTEAQWEFAARGGNKSEGYIYSGSDYAEEVAWFINTSGEATHQVGQKKPNELGIYDMSGNVCEFCSDFYSEYTSDALTDPSGPENGDFYVLRGGGYYNEGQFCRTSYRGNTFPESVYDGYGFRLVMTR